MAAFISMPRSIAICGLGLGGLDAIGKVVVCVDCHEQTRMLLFLGFHYPFVSAKVVS